MDKVHSRARKHDEEAVWGGHDLELFFARQPDKTLPFAHFITEPNGVTWDGIHDPNVDMRFNPPWKCATTRDKDAWYVEIAFPWSTLNMKAPTKGTEIRGNICRHNPLYGDELSAWSAQVGGFLEHNLFGSFRFVD